MAYEDQCGSCQFFEFAGSQLKGYCEWYKTYYYPDDSCSHYRGPNYVAGCFITTVVCNILGKDDDCEVLNDLRKLRNDFMQKDKKYHPLLLEYDAIGPEIAENIEIEYQENEDKTLWQKVYYSYLEPTARLVKENKFDQAITKYVDMVNSLKDYYGIKNDINGFENYDASKGGHGKLKVNS